MAKNKRLPIFVYGSLMQGQRIHQLFEPKLKATVVRNCKAINVKLLCSGHHSYYPYAVRCDGSMTNGDVVNLNCLDKEYDAFLKELDVVESEYNREVILVSHKDQLVECYVYIAKNVTRLTIEIGFEEDEIWYSNWRDHLCEESRKRIGNTLWNCAKQFAESQGEDISDFSIDNYRLTGYDQFVEFTRRETWVRDYIIVVSNKLEEESGAMILSVRVDNEELAMKGATIND